MNKKKITYKKSGVNIKAADKFVNFISTVSSKKKGKKKFSNIGGFGSITALPKNLHQPQIVACTDGVGTKIEIANELRSSGRNPYIISLSPGHRSGSAQEALAHGFRGVYARPAGGLQPPGPPAMNWSSCSQTDPGNQRRHNEDAILALQDYGLWAVADGMGGHRNGALASRLIIDTLGALELTGNIDQNQRRVRQALQQVNRRLTQDMTQVQGQPAGPVGSTVVILLASANRALCLWAGDSRCYLWRQQTENKGNGINR